MMKLNGSDRDELFSALYQKYYTRVLRFVARLSRLDPEDARDLTQDVFVNVYKRLDEYRREAEWSYLETITKNVVLNHVRSISTIKRGANARAKSLDDLTPNEQPHAIEELDLADRQQAEIRQKRLRKAISELTVAQRDALTLRHRGLKYREIAVTLGITEDAVKSRLRDAMRELQTRLGQDMSGMLREEEQ